jgi:hypothetical protein
MEFSSGAAAKKPGQAKIASGKSNQSTPLSLIELKRQRNKLTPFSTRRNRFCDVARH